LRRAVIPESMLDGDAKLPIQPNIDAASLLYILLKAVAGINIDIAPVLLGAAQPAHVLSASALGPLST
jgi:malate dehydrogenase (oxaloacetate-decarboxylating)(NADP+)